MSNLKLEAEIKDFLDKFRGKYGHTPRVLHIGNIANNAYNNAKLLNNIGLDCDVICYDYYHIMGCPEWEDADFQGEITDQFYPDWSSINLNGFQRPKWFAQGPLKTCIYYLIARRTQKKFSEILWWNILNTQRFLFRKFKVDSLRGLLLRLRSKKSAVGWVTDHFLTALKRVRSFFLQGLKGAQRVQRAEEPFDFDKRVSKLISMFESEFPDRIDKMTGKDVERHRRIVPLWRALFAHYDVIQAYATDGIFPLLCDKPYLAYEHGTIRNIPFQETIQGRLCALTYKVSKSVCITNADNIIAVRKLGLRNYRFVPHPVNEEFLKADPQATELRNHLQKTLGSDFVIFHPSRQHWDIQRHPDWEKGNDIFVEGLARFISETNPKASAIFVEWGEKVNDTKRLLEELKIADRVIWISPKPNRQMIRYIHAADLVADQFFLGAFGSIMPKALACGKPVMLYFNDEIHRWCFDKMPPVISAKTEDEVYGGLVRLYTDKEWATTLIEEGRSWYFKYHSNEIIEKTFLEIYSDVIGNGECENEALKMQ